ncbi:MAG TPA: hypothetical protein VJ904_11810, partial [Tichowtungia sp.]|nr:hypothetical protein [Tichowtungia sp.]
MRKNDFIIVGILVVLMFGWMKFYPAIEQRYFPRPEPPAAEPASDPVSEPAEEPDEAITAPAVQDVAEPVQEKPVADLGPEQIQTLENDRIRLSVSSHGGAVLSAVLKDYPEFNTDDSGPVVLNFETAPAL